MNPDLARSWYDRWERQQEHYAFRRAERFAVIGDLLQAAPRPPGVVVDLGSGSGSLAAAITARFPACTAIAVDVDPFLLALGRGVHPGVEFVQAAIGEPGWDRALGGRSVSAFVSSTALHYPGERRLATIYRDCARLLEPGGLLVNADHLPDDDPALAHLTARATALSASHGRLDGVETWEQWWRAAEHEPAFAELLARRAREVPPHTEDNDLTVEQHRRLLHAAAFAHTGVAWRHGHSAVLVALSS